MWDHQEIDKEMVDVMYTNDWVRRDNSKSVKEDIKFLVRNEMSKAKQEQKSKITK